jgi:pimeloyl-ACP methyl ester carboxylesterase
VDFVDVAHTPLAPDRGPARIAYRDINRAANTTPLIVLHGGWGYEIYPCDAQIAALGTRHRIVIPDRSGYGASASIDVLPADFHDRAADETRRVLDALGVTRPVLWGHSDGAIIALRLGLAAPDRVAGIIAEATHYFRRKPRSQAFFEAVIANPASTPIMKLHARAWLQIGADARSCTDDFYDGRLSELMVPALIIHGARDPRTEPGEIDAVRGAVLSGRPARIEMLDAGGHSPHSEPATADVVTALAEAFLATLRGSPRVELHD